MKKIKFMFLKYKKVSILGKSSVYYYIIWTIIIHRGPFEFGSENFRDITCSCIVCQNYFSFQFI